MLESCFLNCQVSNCIPQSPLTTLITPKWPLLKALIFALFQNLVIDCWFFTTKFICFYMHFRGYDIQDTFFSLCSTIIIPSIPQQTTMTHPPDDLLNVFTPVTVIILEETRIKSINQYEWHLMCENFKKSDPKMMIFELHDFLVAHVCNFSRLALQESLL